MSKRKARESLDFVSLMSTSVVIINSFHQRFWCEEEQVELEDQDIVFVQNQSDEDVDERLEQNNLHHHCSVEKSDWLDWCWSHCYCRYLALQPISELNHFIF